MKHFAVIGHPLGHTLSPALHNHIFSRLSLDADYRALDTPPADLAEVAHQLRQGELEGINITLPHKIAFIDYIDEVAPDAAPVGAVNCVVAHGDRLVGHNTDVTGIRHALQQGGFQAKGSSVLLMGAGGAARAAMAALLDLAVSRIRVLDLLENDVQALLVNFRGQAGDVALESGIFRPGLETNTFQLIINATPIGMWPQTDSALLQADQLSSDQTVFDMVYHPEITLLLQRAAEIQCRIVTGLEMFIAQGLASLEHWFPGVIYSNTGKLNPELELPALKSVLTTAIEGHDPINDSIHDEGEKV